MQISKKSILGGVIAILAIVFVACLGRIGEDVKNEQIVVNQFPFTGNMEYWTSPGFKWQWFGKTTHYYKTNQVWFNNISSNELLNKLDNLLQKNDYTGAKNHLLYWLTQYKSSGDMRNTLLTTNELIGLCRNRLGYGSIYDNFGIFRITARSAANRFNIG